MEFSKEKAILIIRRCATLYQQNLLNKNVLFLTSNNNAIDYFEAVFLVRNFKHFTGVSSPLNPTKFFFDALDNKLSKDSINFSTHGTTEIKLNVLPKLMSIHIVARMIGDYDNSKSYLVADKLAGTTTAIMGFKENGNYYVPNTILKEDIRNLTFDPQQKVTATFIKPQKVKLYTELSYITKDIKGFTDNTFEDMGSKIDFSNLHAPFPIPQEIKRITNNDTLEEIRKKQT